MTEADLLTKLATLAYSSISYQRLAEQMLDIMNELGDLDFGNAQQALEDARRSKSPRYELSIAIGHLQDAASKFHRQYEITKRETIGTVAADVFKILRGREPLDEADLAEKGRRCYTMIATIYFDLGERANTLEYANKFRKAFEDHYGSIKKNYEKQVRGELIFSDKENAQLMLQEINKTVVAAQSFLLKINAPTTLLN